MRNDPGSAALRFGQEAALWCCGWRTAPQGSLSVINLGEGTQSWQLRVDGTDGHKLKLFDATRIADALTIDPVGNVGIGTAAPWLRLQDVQGGDDLAQSGDMLWNNGSVAAEGGDQGGSIEARLLLACWNNASRRLSLRRRPPPEQ